MSAILQYLHPTSAVDVFCGVIQPGAWPFAEPLVVEVEVERGSYTVKDIHTNAPLPGLRSYLRRSTRGLPVGRLLFLDNEGTLGVYRARYWRWVRAALIFAAAEFREARFSDYMASLSDPRVTGLEDRVSALNLMPGPYGGNLKEQAKSRRH